MLLIICFLHESYLVFHSIHQLFLILQVVYGHDETLLQIYTYQLINFADQDAIN